MAKGVVADPSLNALRSGSSHLASTSSSLSSRASILASVVPMLRRQPDDVQKTPLLTLRFSSASFLDTTVIDDVIQQPLYTIKTVGPTTTIKRADPWDGDTKTAEIRWSRSVPQKGKNSSDGVLILMRGLRWRGSETFLRRGSARKFKIPNYAQSLKWKQQGNVYWCTTTAVRGPIATLDLGLSTPLFQIFETLHDKNEARPMLVHHGVSILLLDYLLITALFLVTDLQQWTESQVADISIPPEEVTDFPGLTTSQFPPSNLSTSKQQWRKIMYGEPIYPNRSSSNSLHSSSSSSLEALTPKALSTDQMAKVKYGDTIYQMQQSSPTPSTSESEDVSEHVYFSPLATRSHSPASESIFSPVSRSAAPSHTYLDPSYYTDDEDVPPVPLIPAHLNSNSQTNYNPDLRSSTSHPTPSTRRLPDIPVLPPVPPLIPRPRSTPPRPRTSSSIHLPNEAASGPSFSRPLRQLPQPPQTSTSRPDDTHPSPERVRTRTRSVSHSHAPSEREKWQPQAAYRQRMLPTPPTSSSQGDAPPRLRRLVTEDGRFIINKEVDGDLEHWVREAESDMPPPAYNSINFSPKVSDSALQGSVSSAS